MQYDTQWLRDAIDDFLDRYTERTGEARDKLLKRARVDGTIRDFLANRPTRAGGDRGPPQWDILVRLAEAAGTNVFDMLRPPVTGAKAPGRGKEALEAVFDKESFKTLLAASFETARMIKSKMPAEEFADRVVEVYFGFQKQRAKNPKASIKDFTSNVVPLFFEKP